MNEAEKHYSGQGGGTGAGGTGAAAKQGAGASSIVDQAASTARDGLKSAADAAKSATEAARSTASDAYGRASRTVGDAGRRSAAQFKRNRRGVEAFVEENPVMVGVVGLAAGLLIGALLPTTRRENQVFGRYADEVREQGMRYARELAEQGKSMVEENLEAVSKGARGDRDTGDESRAA
jgi:ElaB/YqjD/DUF883 family membrane-anchored ribosome-binding protein